MNELTVPSKCTLNGKDVSSCEVVLCASEVLSASSHLQIMQLF